MRVVALLISVFVIAGCNNAPEQIQRPSRVLDHDSMALVLSEVHILNAMHQHREIRKNRLQAYVLEEYDLLFDSLNVSRERFEESMTWWSADPEKLAGVIDMSINLLNAKSAELKTDKEIEKVPKASADQEALKKMVKEQNPQ